MYLTEKDLNRLVSKVLQEQKSDRYMFFSNLQQIRRQMDILLEMDPSMIEEVLEDGHDWAQDHIATAKESIDQVFDFFMNKDKEEDVFVSKDLIIDHLGNMGSFATDKNLKLDAEKLREWHWMWSTFYFYKKNYGFFYALKKTKGK